MQISGVMLKKTVSNAINERSNYKIYIQIIYINYKNLFN